MSKPELNGCSFCVVAASTDASDFYDMIRAIEERDAAYAKEIEAAFKDHNYDPKNRKATTNYSPPDGEDDWGRFVIVCETPMRLLLVLLACNKLRLMNVHVCASTRGYETESSALVDLTLLERGTHTFIGQPKDPAPLPGLYAARDLIKAEIIKLGGCNGY